MNAILKERVGVSADMGEIIECLRVRISTCQLTNGREIKGENSHANNHCDNVTTTTTTKSETETERMIRPFSVGSREPKARNIQIACKMI